MGRGGTRPYPLIWKYRASSPAPESDATSPLASLGANPCKPMLGKPTVATVELLKIVGFAFYKDFAPAALGVSAIKSAKIAQ